MPVVKDSELGLLLLQLTQSTSADVPIQTAAQCGVNLSYRLEGEPPSHA